MMNKEFEFFTIRIHRLIYFPWRYVNWKVYPQNYDLFSGLATKKKPNYIIQFMDILIYHHFTSKTQYLHLTQLIYGPWSQQYNDSDFVST